MLPRARLETDLALLVVLVDKVLHDRARLKEVDLAAIFVDVGESRNAAVWIDLEEPRVLLLVLRELDFLHLVREAQLFKQNANFYSIGSLSRASEVVSFTDTVNESMRLTIA